MRKKYELTDETVYCGGCYLYRIRALKSFGSVKAGDLGGFVESEHNLSHDGDCWVTDEARVFGNAVVQDAAFVYGKARIFDAATVKGYAKVGDDATIRDAATVEDKVVIRDSVTVEGKAVISGNVWLTHRVTIGGNATVMGYAVIDEDALIYGNVTIAGSIRISGKSKVLDDAHIQGKAIINGKTCIRDKAFIRCAADIGVLEYPKDTLKCFTLYKSDSGLDSNYDSRPMSVEDFLKVIEEDYGKESETYQFYQREIDKIQSRILE